MPRLPSRSAPGAGTRGAPLPGALRARAVNGRNTMKGAMIFSVCVDPARSLRTTENYPAFRVLRLCADASSTQKSAGSLFRPDPNYPCNAGEALYINGGWTVHNGLRNGLTYNWQCDS